MTLNFDPRRAMVTTVVDTDKKQMSERWVLKETGVKTGRLDTVKGRKLAYYGRTMRKQGSCRYYLLIYLASSLRNVPKSLKTVYDVMCVSVKM